MEMRVSLQLAELEREGGFSPHVRLPAEKKVFLTLFSFSVHLWRCVIWVDSFPPMDFQC